MRLYWYDICRSTIGTERNTIPVLERQALQPVPIWDLITNSYSLKDVRK